MSFLGRTRPQLGSRHHGRLQKLIRHWFSTIKTCHTNDEKCFMSTGFLESHHFGRIYSYHCPILSPWWSKKPSHVVFVLLHRMVPCTLKNCEALQYTNLWYNTSVYTTQQNRCSLCISKVYTEGSPSWNCKHGRSSFRNFRSLFRVHDAKSLPLPLDHNSILSVNKLAKDWNDFPISYDLSMGISHLSWNIQLQYWFSTKNMRHLLRRLSLTRLFYHWTIHTSNLLHPDAGQDRTKLFLNNGFPIVTKHYREPETSHFFLALSIGWSTKSFHWEWFK